MTTWILIIAITAAGGVIASLITGLKLAAATKERDELKIQVTALTGDVLKLETQLSQLRDAAEAQTVRLETVISMLKAEISTLSANLNQDPAAVRDRLKQLLGG